METLLNELLGKPVFARTMGAHFLGRLVAIDVFSLKLEQCCWLADPCPSNDATRRQQEYVIAHGLEPEADVQRFRQPYYLNRNQLEGITEWEHDLP